MSLLLALAQQCIAVIAGTESSDGSARPASEPMQLRDDELVQKLLAGDEASFRALVTRLSPLLLRLARSYVRSDALAEEVVQDTWLAVLEGLPGFAGRSSLKTWVVHILINRARTRGTREARVVPLSSLGKGEDSAPSADHFNESGGWRSAPEPISPERLLDNKQTRARVDAAIAALPEQQRLVIELRDVAELDSEEVCELLKLSANNQRVLLHRARDKVRAALIEASDR
jgi:RNA polymerase sigma-70 factor (ECF subfamily)